MIRLRTVAFGAAALLLLLGAYQGWRANSADMAVLRGMVREGDCTKAAAWAWKWDGTSGAFAGIAAQNSYFAAILSVSGTKGAVMPTPDLWTRDLRLLHMLTAQKLVEQGEYARGMEEMRQAGMADRLEGEAVLAYGRGDYMCSLFYQLMAKDLGSHASGDPDGWAASLIANGHEEIVREAYVAAARYNPARGEGR